MQINTKEPTTIITTEKLVNIMIWAYRTGWQHAVETLSQSSQTINIESLKEQFNALLNDDQNETEDK